MITVQHIIASRGNQAVFAVMPGISVYEALKVMGEHNVGSVLVMDEQKNLLGILTERDYARKIVLKGKRSQETLVSEIMTGAEKLVTVSLETSLDDCMEKMSGNKIRHLPVIENKKVHTVISIGDVVAAVIRQQKETIEHLSSYIHGGSGQ